MRKFIALISVELITMSSTTFAATCDAQAAAKKLTGAVKNSFTKKCFKDATGS